MEFGVLGPLLIRTGAGPVSVASAKQRALLAVLLLEAGQVVAADRLIDELWGEDPPSSAVKALQVHVSQLRRALAPAEPIVTHPTGYAIRIAADGFDLHRLEELLARSRRDRAAGDRAGALEALNEGLALWRGPSLADVTLLGSSASERRRLEGLRAVAQEELMELRLSQDDAATLVPELEALVTGEPYRERRHALLILALYRAGRQADALEAYRRARTLLVEDLGLEPGPELVRLEAAILAQDPALDPAHGVARLAAHQPAGRGFPRFATTTLGRAAELRSALALIERPDVRLVTLRGAPGIGKTRLALELTSRIEGRTYLVELAPLAEPGRVLAAIAGAMGIEDVTADAIATALRREPTVLFLDNFEHVIDAAPAVASLLTAVPSLTVVVTSRAPLRVAGEWELPVPPLAREPAVELFVSRASERDPDYSPDAGDLDSIAAICEHVDRLPLAIELAAARTPVLSTPEILRRIAQRLELLTVGRRDAPERQRTLRATISWSHDLLDGAERRLFAQLAVFHSGWSIEAAEAVADGPVLDTLSALVDHSLVTRDGARFRMLETVREYATERLEASDDASSLRRRHALWCLDLVESVEHELEGPKQSASFARLDPEQADLRAAATWAVANREPEIALALDSTLWRYWLARGAAREVRAVLTTALASGRGDTRLRANALKAAGVMAGTSNDFSAARAFSAEALTLAAQANDRQQIARILMNLGLVDLYTGDHASAVERYMEAGAIWDDLGDLRGQSVMRQNLATVYGVMGDFERAVPVLEQSLELARAAGDGMQVAATAVELAKQLLQYQPDDPQILSLLREGLELVTALGERRHIIECLEVIAAFCARAGTPRIGAELIGAAEAERTRAGVPRLPDERPLYEIAVRELEQALGPEGYDRERKRGHELTRAVAVALALKSVDPSQD